MPDLTPNHIVSYMITAAAADASAALIKLQSLTREYYYEMSDSGRDDYDKLVEGVRLINEALHIQSAAPITIS